MEQSANSKMKSANSKMQIDLQKYFANNLIL